MESSSCAGSVLELMIAPRTLDDKTALYIGHGLLSTEILSKLCRGYRPVILADSTVNSLYGKQLGEVLEIPIGEKAKTREVKERIEDEMLERGFGRDTVVIGLGGGAALDLAAFIASTYLRGVALILIPTTLLAMVDAAIGGKTGVDTPHGKNLIGTVYHPKAIISDLEVLKTLPKHEMQNGLSEVFKMGLISDASIFQDRDLEESVVKSAKAKIAIVEQDPTEKGLRRILNFGHTIGHGLETISRYSLSHGQAVAIGCVTESYLSFCMGYLSKTHYDEIEALFQKHFPSLRLPASYDRDTLFKAFSFDKKRSSSGVRFVLIDQIGHALCFDGQYCQKAPLDQIDAALTKMENLYG